MYNPNSVILQNMGQQLGVQPVGYTPPVPIGNIANITGAAGYNGGYYNGVYNNYYNPYLAAKQEEIRKTQEKEARRQQSSVMKLLSKAAHAEDNSEVTDEQLDEYYDYHPVEEMSKKDREWLEIQKLAQQPPIEYNGYYVQKAYMDAYNKSNKYVRPDMSLEEFLEAGWDIMADILEREQSEKQKDLSVLYNKDNYSRLINGNQYSNNLFKKEVSIDDMSVFPNLSQKSKQEYAARKAQFMAAIMNNREV